MSGVKKQLNKSTDIVLVFQSSTARPPVHLLYNGDILVFRIPSQLFLLKSFIQIVKYKLSWVLFLIEANRKACIFCLENDLKIFLAF